MNKYEGMFLLDSRPFPKGWEEAQEHVHAILQKHGAKVLVSGKWDERKLAYPVKRQKRGIYVLVFFEAEPRAVATIERDCQLSEAVLRALVLRHEGEIPKDPFKPATPPVEAVAAPAVAAPVAEPIPELSEAEGSGPVDWEER